MCVHLISFNPLSDIPGDLPNHLKDRFQGQWYLLNGLESSKYYSMTGGLASPPESQINSPLFFQGSSATASASGNFSPVQCVNPRDLHDSNRFFPDHFESDEEDDLSEQDVSSPVIAQSHLMASSRRSSVQPSSPPAISENDLMASSRRLSVQPSSPPAISENDLMASSRRSSVQPSSPPAISENDFDADRIIAAEALKPALRGDEDNDENAAVAGIQSRESPSIPQKDDATTMAVDHSRAPSSEPPEDDATMVSVSSRKPTPEPRDLPSHPQEDDATTMLVDQPRSPSSEPLDDDATMVGAPSRKPSPEPHDNEEGGDMVGVESDDGLAPLSDLSDLEEDNEEGGPANGDDEEYQPAKAVKLSDSSENKKFAGPIVGAEEATPKAGMESDQMLLDFESSVNLQEQFPLRRSSRNVFSKKKPTINYADCAPPRKSSSGRKKLPLEDEYHQMVSLQNFPSNKLN